MCKNVGKPILILTVALDSLIYIIASPALSQLFSLAITTKRKHEMHMIYMRREFLQDWDFSKPLDHSLPNKNHRLQNTISNK